MELFPPLPFCLDNPGETLEASCTGKGVWMERSTHFELVTAMVRPPGTSRCHVTTESADLGQAGRSPGLGVLTSW